MRQFNCFRSLYALTKINGMSLTKRKNLGKAHVRGSFYDTLEENEDTEMTINKKLPVSATRGPDGQWIFDPPFTGDSYPEFKAWHHHAQEAAKEHLRLNGKKLSNVVSLGIPNLMVVNWNVLSPDDAVLFATEAIDSCEAEEVFTVSWDFGTPMHNGIEIAYQIGSRFFAQTESGLLAACRT